MKRDGDFVDLCLSVKCVVNIEFDDDFLLSIFESESEFLAPRRKCADFSFLAHKLFLVHEKREEDALIDTRGILISFIVSGGRELIAIYFASHYTYIEFATRRIYDIFVVAFEDLAF